METILRSEEMAEIMLIPVRHHSPACACHIKKIFAQWKPDAVLVEGPDNANALLPVMVHSDTRAPFAIYYAYHDKAKKISQEQQHYKCYYPFLDYSPELTALREAHKNMTYMSFIDLSYGDILAASAEKLVEGEAPRNYNDDYLLARNDYIDRLCEKTGLRSFDEFWEKYFEINGLYEESDIWFSHLMTYCCLARKSTSTESMEGDGCLEREAHMAAKIVQCAMFHGMKGEKEGQWEENLMAWMEPYRILVITGGFHTPGIRERLSGSGWEETKRLLDSKTVRIPREYQSVYLMPYSMEAADALNGYASGMPFAGFYQKVWEGSGETETPYEKAVLDMLVTVGKEVRKKEGYLSTYDEICAWQMAQGLGELRGKPQPGAFELWDAVLASYVKGEYNISSAMPMMILKKQMIGRGVGSLCPLADVPPILHDFEAKCKNFGLKVRAASETETILSIFSSKKHRNESMFFHQTVFVGTSFARRVKGPNLQLGKDKNLIRETVYTLRLLEQQRLVHPLAPAGVVTDILIMDFSHGIRQSLILPRPLPSGEMPVKTLPAHLQNPTVQGDFSFLSAAVRLLRNKPHSMFPADFRRLAAKKALASAKNSFSSFSRRFSRSSALLCLRSVPNSSARLMASTGPRLPGPASSRPSRTAFCHPYTVSTGIPSSFAAFPAPLSLASFTACTLYSFSYFLCPCAIFEHLPFFPYCTPFP